MCTDDPLLMTYQKNSDFPHFRDISRLLIYAVKKLIIG
ncbi:hypothetical protein DDI_3918 [Dickeya dianthicola RNS04.9]|nr:hypothetical protein DDI_3918 [Dickeya dianthicola RNS04.9]